jgi:NAD(P)-dependent dehydrogenase (short-subunit alcohol dehydrogenase family)
MKTVLVLGITSDIGRELAVRYERDGWRVAGTLREGSSLAPESTHWQVFPCDLSVNSSVDAAIAHFADIELRWDLLVVAAGTEEPIAPFNECDADHWEKGIAINALAPLRLLRGVHPLRNPDGGACVAFFSGAGTNNAAPSYSAYCASKVFLIKMCELLDAESSDTGYFIIGPGIVRTKIHEQTLKVPEKSGANFTKVTNFLRSSGAGTSHDDIYSCLQWCVRMGKPVVGGRNISLVFDAWRGGGATLAAELKANGNLYKLRRYGNDLRF